MNNIGDFLNLLTNVKISGQDQWTSDCPCQSHKTPAKHLSIGLKDDKILLTCFGSDTADDIVKALGLELSDLFIKPEEKPKLTAVKEKIVAEYDYQDEAGNLLYQHIRYEPKNFRYRHQNGSGEWVWNLDSVRRVLYHLPEIGLADGTIYLVEGEKDADNLWKWGQVATTSDGGASSWQPEYADYLKGKRVVIIPDNDPAGFAYAKSAALSLKGIAEELKCIILDNTFKDISDWLESGHTIEELGEQDISALDQSYIFENKGSRYIFKWGKLHCEVSRIKATHGITSCQLVWTDNGQHILRTKFNLESSRVRSELAKDLLNRKKNIDWKQLLEDLANRTLEEFEQGEPVITLHSNDEVGPLEYLVHPILPLNKPTVFFGDPGAGKSQMMVALAILVSLPWTDNPLRLGAPPKPVKVLILDYEADPDDLRRQLGSLVRGMDLGYIEFHYKRCSLPLADDIEAIKSQIETIGATCIFIDSVSLAAGGDLNAMDRATGYFRTLRSLGAVTSLSLAHTNKNRESKDKTILGSVLFEAGARSVFEVRGQEDEDCLDIALFHKKANLSKKSKPLGYRIAYKNDLPVNITWHDPKSVADFIARMTLKTRLIEYLKDNRKAAVETIAQDLNENKASVRSRLNEGKDKMFVRFENSTRIEGKLVDEWGLLSGYTV